MGNVSVVWEHCRQRLQATKMDTASLWTVFGSNYYGQLFLRGQWGDSLAVQPPLANGAVHLEQWYVFAAAQALAQGKRDEAILTYQTGLKLMRKRQNSRKALFGGKLEILSVLALLLDGKDKSLKDAIASIKEFSHKEPVYIMLAYFADSQLTGKVPSMPDDVSYYLDSPLTLLFGLIVRYWLGHAIPASCWDQVATHYRQADEAGYAWLAGEYATVLAQLLPDMDKRKPLYAGLSAAAHDKAGTQPLITLYQPQPVWERTLLALQRLGHTVAPTAGNTPKKVWSVLSGC